jgi:DNA polymerase III delta prime subunit
MSEFAIKPASRVGIAPLVGFYGPSGSGKTLSALLFARGLVGPTGRITLVDTENKRGSMFSDIVPGGYGVIELDAPFSPDRYAGAISAAASASDIAIVDTLSHEWSGEGGVLDWQEDELDRMAGQDWDKRERCKMAAWIKPKMAHKRFIGELLRLKCGLICCLRGEQKTHMAKPGQSEKGKVFTDEFSSPLFDPRFIFEMLINFETVRNERGEGGCVIARKITHPSVAPLLPKPGEQIGISHGEALARWLGNPARAEAGAPKKGALENQLDVLKKELWHLLVSKHGGDRKALEQWLWDENLMSDTESLSGLTPGRLSEIIAGARTKLQSP